MKLKNGQFSAAVDLKNTPRRPWEASETSGMKVLVNGGINPSELDVGGPKHTAPK